MGRNGVINLADIYCELVNRFILILSMNRQLPPQQTNNSMMLIKGDVFN